MKVISKAELVLSAAKKEQWPESQLKEICLAGRSNVGKSSLINTLCSRKKLAYVGNKPGKTRLLNFFNIDDEWMLVDVPGYGYANASKTMLIQFGQMMEDYFAKREQLKGMILIVDIRHKPTEDDCMMLEFARYHQIPTCIVATKADKLSHNKQIKQIEIIRKTLLINENEPLVLFSAETGKGREALWNEIERF